MGKMIEFIKKMLASNSGISSKRFITLIAFLLMATGFISNLFWDVTIEEFIYESMKWIVIGGLGFTASEQFTGKGGTTSTVLTPMKKVDLTQLTKKEEPVIDEPVLDVDEDAKGVDLNIK